MKACSFSSLPTLTAALLITQACNPVTSFSVALQQTHNYGRSPLLSAMSSSMFEYEYIPPNEGGSHDFRTTLPSVYPAGTPAGMRGEAVRAALRSSQCLAWKLATCPQSAMASPNLASGLLKLNGKGVLAFLNNKLSNSFPEKSGMSFAKACLLTSKGRLVDTLAIAYAETQAFVMPSPGHAGSALFQRLDPFIFPLDEVELTDLSENTCLFSLASTEWKHLDDVVEKYLLPKLKQILPGASGLAGFALPKTPYTLMIHLNGRSSSGDDSVVVFPHTWMPDCAMVGYTFAFSNEARDAGNKVWQYLVGDENPRGPVEIKALEFESLRIEAGQPAFGYEVTGAWKEPRMTSPTPLELHQKADVIDFDKGCYLGQEGIASSQKNPRGPPRSLYSVIFEDDDNIYQYQSEGDNSRIDNLTTMPKAGDKLYVLGSNEDIQVGVLTSVAEPYSTGDTTIVGLALIGRADSILKQMKAKDLQIPREMAKKLATISVGSTGIIAPPPMDSLDGLEIMVGGTFTVGILRGVPSRRFPKGKNMYMDQEQILTREEILDQGYVDIQYSGMSAAKFLKDRAAELDNNEDDVEEDELKSLAEMVTEDEAETEAQRKASKMTLLMQQAEEARARRRKEGLKAGSSDTEVVNTAAETETYLEESVELREKRKAEKLKLLQQRAEEAIARRRSKKKTQL